MNGTGLGGSDTSVLIMQQMCLTVSQSSDGAMDFDPCPSETANRQPEGDGRKSQDNTFSDNELHHRGRPGIRNLA